MTEDDSAMDLSWPNGSVRVHTSDRPGVTGMSLRGGPAGGIAIGPARLGTQALHDTLVSLIVEGVGTADGQVAGSGGRDRAPGSAG
ncbi:hypothetical protein AB0F17_07380 [Nonomuraea sp. NPDC026600]|uniref:hypothetical protein n=1 Tax=Nonomuraea sp. NPDC026600 TaxID=3155363 RepID=UPI0033F5ED8B